MLTNDIKMRQLNTGKDMVYSSKCKMTVFKIQTKGHRYMYPAKRVALCLL